LNGREAWLRREEHSFGASLTQEERANVRIEIGQIARRRPGDRRVLCGECTRSHFCAIPAIDDGVTAILLTIFLRHDQTKTLDEINDHLKKTGWYDEFPPQGVEIVSWYVMMGVGQVVTLRVPADKLREVNRVIEQSAWGGYRTEFYPTYDYKSVWEAMPGHHP
jgi:hypothetical protein